MQAVLSLDEDKPTGIFDVCLRELLDLKCRHAHLGSAARVIARALREAHYRPGGLGFLQARDRFYAAGQRCANLTNGRA